MIALLITAAILAFCCALYALAVAVTNALLDARYERKTMSAYITATVPTDDLPF